MCGGNGVGMDKGAVRTLDLQNIGLIVLGCLVIGIWTFLKAQEVIFFYKKILLIYAKIIAIMALQYT